VIGLLPERMVGVGARLSPIRRLPDGPDEPSTPRHDRRDDGPQSVAGDAAILYQRGIEVQRIFWTSAGSVGIGGGPRILSKTSVHS
jgi:hypothetical protein